ncbi:hypothetical protein ACSNOH_25420 [Streptomyces sp. URMC 127]|uniref:hypothetical protein n=1 Tax=Streptomyces sp. URMC 127 TaxID=3423402 RepID=UPI003F1986DE
MAVMELSFCWSVEPVCTVVAGIVGTGIVVAGVVGTGVVGTVVAGMAGPGHITSP